VNKGNPMTQSKQRFASFEEYLSFTDDEQDNVRYELIDGEFGVFRGEEAIALPSTVSVQFGVLALTAEAILNADSLD
jgi:hypothetical protein